VHLKLIIAKYFPKKATDRQTWFMPTKESIEREENTLPNGSSNP
jgi:hypothetical protein